MAERDKSRFWRRCRIAFRRFRICVHILILIFLCGLIYLNQVGLPGFLKGPLLEKLRERGIALEFSRLRWRWYHGIVAENVRFGRPDDTFSPRLDLKEVQVRLNGWALARFHLQVDSLVLRDGRLAWSIAASNEPPRELLIENIRTDLRLLPGDLWELDEFHARFGGASFQVTGTLTNASATREWNWFRPKQPALPGQLQDGLRQLADALQRIHFSSQPRLSLDVRGDARDLQSFKMRMKVDAPDADTPWGSFTNGLLTILLFPTTANSPSQAEINLRAATVKTDWMSGSNFVMTLRLLSNTGETNVLGELDTTAESVVIENWGRAVDARFHARWLHSLTNPVPLSGRGELFASDAETQWGRVGKLQLTGNLSSATNEPAGDPSWGPWADLAPFGLDWQCRIENLRSPRLNADEIVCDGDWVAPRLTVRRLTGALYGGEVRAQSVLNVANREFRFIGASDFDAQRINPLLTPKARQWMSQFTWAQPPAVEARGFLVLPAWTNREPNWRADVRPTLNIEGKFQIANGSFRKVPFTSAQSHFSYSNSMWRLPNIVAVRPEGRIYLAHEANDSTRDFYFRVQSAIDVRAARPLLPPEQQRVLDLLAFTRPPVIDGEVWGRWDVPERTGIRARVAITNFTFRGESIDGVQSAMEFTNGIVRVMEPRLQRGTQQVSAAFLRVDIPGNKIFVTNGFSTAEPMVVARAIGPRIVRAIQPYSFAQPPAVRVNGIIPTREARDADLHFEVEGNQFAWWKLRAARVSGRLDWVGDRLSLSEVRAQFYNGSATGAAEFDFSPRTGTDFKFDMVATDAEFPALIRDLSGRTNHMEGLMTVRLSVTGANTEDWQSVQGLGRANLRDGLIWEIPVFGIFSPVLDAVMPGLGSSRAREGSATFIITNGVVRTDDLQIHTSGARLQYWGTVDLQNRVNARVEAELFRDTWMVGRIISLALWPLSKVFEYQITGTLQEPKTAPVYFVPKIVRLPVDILREIRDTRPYTNSFSTNIFEPFPTAPPN